MTFGEECLAYPSNNPSNSSLGHNYRSIFAGTVTQPNCKLPSAADSVGFANSQRFAETSEKRAEMKCFMTYLTSIMHIIHLAQIAAPCD